MTSVSAALAGWDESDLEHDGSRRTVFTRGRGPGVVVIHEIPGITPEVLRFAERVVDAGFRVYLPHLFGTPGRPFSTGTVAVQMVRACISREFHVLARNHASPITRWLRGLCRSAFHECGGRGVGAVGMCLTGNFALALMVDERLMAPVLSQPSLPFPVTPSHRRALHLSPEELEVVRRRAAAGCGVLGLRFTRDPLCPPERFERLRQELGGGFEAIEIDSSPGNPWGIPRTAHSVLTVDLVDRDGHPTREALERVLVFLRERLGDVVPVEAGP